MAHLQPPYDPYYFPPPQGLPPQPLPENYMYSTIPTPNSKDRNGGINTLFVSGLPDDVKAREIHNLFRRRPGFEFCQLKYTGRGNQVVAFATFVNHQAAMAALHALNGVKFDPQTGSSLHIELARSNSRRKNKAGSGPYVVIDKRTKSSTDAHETSSDDGDSDDLSRPNNPDSSNKDDSIVERSDEVAADADNSVAPESEQIEKTVDSTQACSTLFIANLGPLCTEDELMQTLAQYPGFNSLKLRARGGMPVAFADFQGVEQASEAMNALQGSSLQSSDRGGMHIEYILSIFPLPSDMAFRIFLLLQQNKLNEILLWWSLVMQGRK